MNEIIAFIKEYCWTKDLNIKPDTLTLTEEKVGNRHEHTGTEDNFLNRMSVEHCQ